MRTVTSCSLMILIAMAASFGATGCAEEYREPKTSDDPLVRLYQSETVAQCRNVCVEDFKAHCTGNWPPSEASCQDICEEEIGGLDGHCLVEADTWYMCMWFQPATCNGGGVTHGRACDADYDKFIACIQAY